MSSRQVLRCTTIAVFTLVVTLGSSSAVAAEKVPLTGAELQQAMYNALVVIEKAGGLDSTASDGFYWNTPEVMQSLDAIPDKEFSADIDWISPIASLIFKGFGASEKVFPTYATLKSLDPRLRPGMSASVEIIIESQPRVLLIPLRASFLDRGKPSVWVQRGAKFQVRAIEVGKQNSSEVVVLKGLTEQELVALEDPQQAAKRAKKL